MSHKKNKNTFLEISRPPLKWYNPEFENRQSIEYLKQELIIHPLLAKVYSDILQCKYLKKKTSKKKKHNCEKLKYKVMKFNIKTQSKKRLDNRYIKEDNIQVTYEKHHQNMINIIKQYKIIINKYKKIYSEYSSEKLMKKIRENDFKQWSLNIGDIITHPTPISLDKKLTKSALTKKKNIIFNLSILKKTESFNQNTDLDHLVHGAIYIGFGLVCEIHPYGKCPKMFKKYRINKKTDRHLINQPCFSVSTLYDFISNARRVSAIISNYKDFINCVEDKPPPEGYTIKQWNLIKYQNPDIKLLKIKGILNYSENVSNSTHKDINGPYNMEEWLLMLNRVISYSNKINNLKFKMDNKFLSFRSLLKNKYNLSEQSYKTLYLPYSQDCISAAYFIKYGVCKFTQGLQNNNNNNNYKKLESNIVLLKIVKELKKLYNKYKNLLIFDINLFISIIKVKYNINYHINEKVNNHFILILENKKFNSFIDKICNTKTYNKKIYKFKNDKKQFKTPIEYLKYINLFLIKNKNWLVKHNIHNTYVFLINEIIKAFIKKEIEFQKIEFKNYIYKIKKIKWIFNSFNDYLIYKINNNNISELIYYLLIKLSSSFIDKNENHLIHTQIINLFIQLSDPLKHNNYYFKNIKTEKDIFEKILNLLKHFTILNNRLKYTELYNLPIKGKILKKGKEIDVIYGKYNLLNYNELKVKKFFNMLN
jgi:hypothetical protein